MIHKIIGKTCKYCILMIFDQQLPVDISSCSSGFIRAIMTKLKDSTNSIYFDFSLKIMRPTSA